MATVERLIASSNLGKIADMMRKTRVKKPIFAIGASVGREYLAPLAEKASKVLIAFNAFSLQKCKEALGTIVFPYEFKSLPYSCKDDCKTSHLYNANGTEIYQTGSDFLWHALSGTFSRRGSAMDRRFNEIQFSRPAVYIPEPLRDPELIKYAFDYLLEEYLNIMALPLLAIQARILKRAKKELQKEYKDNFHASLDPAHADKSRITGRYSELARSAKDEYKMPVSFEDCALSFFCSVDYLKKRNLLSLIVSPYDFSLASRLAQDSETAALRRQIRRVFQENYTKKNLYDAS